MVEYTDLKENSAKITDRDEALIIYTELVYYFIDFDGKKKKTAFKISICFLPLFI